MPRSLAGDLTKYKGERRKIRETDRQTETETERQRQRQRQTDRATETETQRERESDIDRKTETENALMTVTVWSCWLGLVIPYGKATRQGNEMHSVINMNNECTWFDMFWVPLQKDRDVT